VSDGILNENIIIIILFTRPGKRMWVLWGCWSELCVRQAVSFYIGFHISVWSAMLAVCMPVDTVSCRWTGLPLHSSLCPPTSATSADQCWTQQCQSFWARLAIMQWRAFSVLGIWYICISL